jgi:hypothetical protein
VQCADLSVAVEELELEDEEGGEYSVIVATGLFPVIFR